MDYRIFRAINDFFADHSFVERPVTVYVRASEVLFVLLLALLFFVLGARGRVWVRRAAIAAGLSAGLALAVGQPIAAIVDRVRPFTAHPSAHVFLPRTTDPSFPSDHATAAFAIAVSIRLRNKLWGNVALVMALVLSIGRVGDGMHYPGDVIAGALLGSAVALALWIRWLRALADRLADLASAIWEQVASRALGFVRRPSEG